MSKPETGKTEPSALERVWGALYGEERDEERNEEREEKVPIALLIAAALFVSGAVVCRLLSVPTALAAVWMAVAAALLLIPIAREAVEEWQARRMGENTLLIIATVAAFVIGEWTEAALVLVLFTLGEWLEDKATGYSRRTIASLAAVAPDVAWRVGESGRATKIPAAKIAAGDILRIPPHTLVPADCTVLEGESSADASALTGESEPLYVNAGTELLSGCMNGDGTLTVRAEKPAGESAAARIMRLVEDSAQSKGRSERFITRFAQWYTPIVTVMAVLVAVIPPLCIPGEVWQDWLYRALVFLVASCPCALVISIPLGFYAGIAAAARRGVLIKGSIHVETLAAVEVMAFDKTGTLTTGEVTLSEVICLDPNITSEQALMLAAALEGESSHPLARAIAEADASGGELIVDAQDAPVREAPKLTVTDRREIAGLGVSGTVRGAQILCGNKRLMEAEGVDTASLPDAAAYLAVGGHVMAAFVTAEGLRDGVREVVEALQADSHLHLRILTGDREKEAAEVARAVGLVGNYKAGLLPEGKLDAVQEIQEDGWVTAFVGDGINDAPVLAAADVGIAMGFGSPAAIETADVVLMSDGLTRLPATLWLCRKVVRIVRENIAFALAVKAAVLVLAVFGFAPMWLAVFADMGVTMLSIFNSLRLLFAAGK